MADGRGREERAEREIAALCRRGMRWTSLWPAVERALRAAVPFEAAAFAATDPTTLLPTAGILDALPDGYCAAILRNEIEAEDFDKLASLARAPRPVGVLGVSTGGQPERSPRYREVLAPLGLARQARSACVDRGRCWAWLDVYRERGSPEFTLEEARVLERVARRVARAVRVSLLFADGPARAPGEEAGVVLLGPGLEVVASDAAAARWLAELAPGGGAVPLAVQAVAASACWRERDGAAGPARTRTRARSGRWLVLHAFRPRSGAGIETVVVIEPATPGELAELRVSAFGLTPAERRVLELTLAGCSTKEIAAALAVSPYTARDHLTHVFDKTGARSRAQLFALLAAQRPPHRVDATGPDADLGAASR